MAVPNGRVRMCGEIRRQNQKTVNKGRNKKQEKREKAKGTGKKSKEGLQKHELTAHQLAAAIIMKIRATRVLPHIWGIFTDGKGTKLNFNFSFGW